MAIAPTDETEANRNVRVRRATDRFSARLRAVHGDLVRQPGEIRVTRNDEQHRKNQCDNGANERNAPAHSDFHLFQAVSLLDG